jgi:tight adherence protein C
MLVLAILLLLLGIFLTLEAIAAPKRERRALLRRASTYGKPRGAPTPTSHRLGERVTKLFENSLANTVLKINPKTNVDLVRTRLVLAGLQRRISPVGFLALRGCSGVAGLVLGLLLGASGGHALGAIALSLAFGALGFVIPEFGLSSITRSRRERIAAALPDALDLLAVSVEAGLGFDGAVVKLIEQMDGPLIDELGLTLTEIRMGQTRHAALKALTERVDSREMKAFVRAVVQADQLGLSLGRILRLQASETRLKRQAVAEEKAMKLPVKMLFPTVLFIFPSVFLIVLGPAFLNFGQYF